jgi:hypothetical protein
MVPRQEIHNAVYTIVGFAGLRVLNYWLDGQTAEEERNHYVIVQPAIVIDRSAIADDLA